MVLFPSLKKVSCFEVFSAIGTSADGAWTDPPLAFVPQASEEISMLLEAFGTKLSHHDELFGLRHLLQVLHTLVGLPTVGRSQFSFSEPFKSSQIRTWVSGPSS